MVAKQKRKTGRKSLVSKKRVKARVKHAHQNTRGRAAKLPRAGRKASGNRKHAGRTRKNAARVKPQRKHGRAAKSRKPTSPRRRTRASQVGKYPRTWDEIDDLPGLDTPHDYSGDTNGKRK